MLLTCGRVAAFSRVLAGQTTTTMPLLRTSGGLMCGTLPWDAMATSSTPRWMSKGRERSFWSEDRRLRKAERAANPIPKPRFDFVSVLGTPPWANPQRPTSPPRSSSSSASSTSSSSTSTSSSASPSSSTSSSSSSSSAPSSSKTSGSFSSFSDTKFYRRMDQARLRETNLKLLSELDTVGEEEERLFQQYPEYFDEHTPFNPYNIKEHAQKAEEKGEPSLEDLRRFFTERPASEPQPSSSKKPPAGKKAATASSRKEQVQQHMDRLQEEFEIQKQQQEEHQAQQQQEEQAKAQQQSKAKAKTQEKQQSQDDDDDEEEEAEEEDDDDEDEVGYEEDDNDRRKDPSYERYRKDYENVYGATIECNDPKLEEERLKLEALATGRGVDKELAREAAVLLARGHFDERWGKDPHRVHSERWFRVAAQLGDAYATRIYGVRFEPRKSQRLVWLAKAADLGDLTAMEMLAEHWMERKDGKRSFEWNKRASEAGSAVAPYNLYVLLARGLGVTMDSALARKYLQLSAERGFAEAMWRLGHLEQSESWIGRAAEAGLASAQYFVAQRCLKRGDNQKAAEWFHRAADGGNHEAAYFLSRSYMQNTLSPPPALAGQKPIDIAADLLARAAAEGHRPSQELMKIFSPDQDYKRKRKTVGNYRN